MQERETAHRAVKRLEREFEGIRRILCANLRELERRCEVLARSRKVRLRTFRAGTTHE